MNNILINEVENNIRIYLETKHPIESNGFIIRLSDNINQIYERRRSYIVRFPFINPEIINQIVDSWSEYALNNIIEDYDLNQPMTILSIDPLKFSTIYSDIVIMYSGEVINPEIIIRKLSIDIIEQMNKHMIELYMDQSYPEIDIDNPQQRDQFNEIFNNIEMEQIYGIYPQVEIYIGLDLKSNSNPNFDSELGDITFYINGTIETKSQIIDIIDDIRLCLDSDNQNEIISYDKDDIVFKYRSNKELQNFSIITDPQI